MLIIWLISIYSMEAAPELNDFQEKVQSWEGLRNGAPEQAQEFVRLRLPENYDSLDGVEKLDAREAAIDEGLRELAADNDNRFLAETLAAEKDVLREAREAIVFMLNIDAHPEVRDIVTAELRH